MNNSPEFVFQVDLLTRAVQQVLASMPAGSVAAGLDLSDDSPLMATLKRVTAELTVVLAGAKTTEDDQDFADSFGLIKDLDVAGHGGFIGVFARALIQCDRESAKEESIIDDCIDPQIVEQRLNQIDQFIGRLPGVSGSA